MRVVPFDKIFMLSNNSQDELTDIIVKMCILLNSEL
jgi:hypothetical protein